MRPCRRFQSILASVCGRMGSGKTAKLSTRRVAEETESKRSRLNAFVPKSDPIADQDIEKLQNFIDQSSRIFILTGAGISTESGIPDYRSKDVGLYDRVSHRPMQHSDFIKGDKGRQRYWARNYVGWSRFTKHRPNCIHHTVADWESKGLAYWTVTQNVDALHTHAGSRNLTELHGCLGRVICLDCGDVSSRADLQTRLDNLNPDWTTTSSGFGPDADAFIRDEDVEKFRVAPCGNCGGRLKPDVVFFGDNVRRIKVERAYSILSSCDSMLVLGSSLYVWSGYRFVVRASELSIPVACVNIGQTRADDKFSVKVNAKCSDVLKQIVVS